MERPTVAICLPAPSKVDINFALSLAGIAHVTPVKLVLIRGHSSLSAAKARNICLEKLIGIEQIIRHRVDWTFWLDSDMQVPPNTIAQLLSHGKPIVGACYKRRTPPHDLMGVPKDSMIQTTGVAPFIELPAGCLLVRRDVFDKVGRWMILQPGEQADSDVGEDVVFSRKAIIEGFELWADLDLTREVIHWGDLALQETGEDSSLVHVVPPKLINLSGAAMNGRA